MNKRARTLFASILTSDDKKKIPNIEKGDASTLDEFANFIAEEGSVKALNALLDSASPKLTKNQKTKKDKVTVLMVANGFTF